ncbi:putative aminotransferase [Pseudomassariella vexata]|uniref:Putative aminotransferase n=1 Tax=Pseudomassariella vexata TaxID=1141098 RepID=A0A1Y2EHA7_9PEZI|nr:putative aminotransferase [Pseudomassariella vexata]ORY70953.1 putative aminotransferase [Pseudomassariella vexata]
MAAQSMLTNWIRGQKLKAPQMKNARVFDRNLEEALDVRRADHAMFTPNISAWKSMEGVDFCSNDILHLGSTGQIRAAFEEELTRHPNYNLYSGDVRMLDRNYEYIQQVECEIAEFHGAETALIVNSGFEGNGAIFCALPRPGDAIVYDELVHASTLDGMAFREVLSEIVDSERMIREGTRCVLVAVESVYSMDGDVCPLRELVDVAKEICPKGNVEFIIDEAHGTGVVGPKGAGSVNALGMEKEIAVRLHTCGKGLASTGAAILGNATVRAALTNFARSVVYTTAPTFLMIAAMRAGYNLLRSGKKEKAQDNIQHLVKRFVNAVRANQIFQKASEMGIVWVPLCEDMEERDFLVHIVPIRTRQRYSYWLAFHLQLDGYCILPIDYPVVLKGQSRLRLIVHGANTEEQIDGIAKATCEWAREMVDIETGADASSKIAKSAQQVY